MDEINVVWVHDVELYIPNVGTFSKTDEERTIKRSDAEPYIALGYMKEVKRKSKKEIEQ